MSDLVERLDEQREAEIFLSFNRPTATRWDDADIDCLLRILRRERSRIRELEGERDRLRERWEEITVDWEKAMKWHIMPALLDGGTQGQERLAQLVMAWGTQKKRAESAEAERDTATRALGEMRAALEVIAGGDGDPAVIASQTLAFLSKTEKKGC